MARHTTAPGRRVVAPRALSGDPGPRRAVTPIHYAIRMIRIASAVILVAVVGCGRAAPSVQHRVTAPPPSPLDRARAFERGTGVARDYAQAAAIYAQACQDGRGDRVACRRLLLAILEGRGADGNRARAAAIARTLCDQTADDFGCFLHMYTTDREDQVSPGVARAFDRERVCDADHLDVCETGMDLVFSTKHGSTHEWKERAFNERGCALGVLDRCRDLVHTVTWCADEPGAAACVERAMAGWRKADDQDRLDAVARLGKACDAGDAGACGALPGRELAPSALCSAHDWAACAVAGCLGDTRAARLAEQHGGTANCDREIQKDQARRAPPPPPPPQYPPLHADPVPAIQPAHVPPFRAIVFRQLGERDDYGWPTYEIYNAGDREVISLSARLYGYDAAGTLVARGEFPATVYGGLGLAPGGHTTISFPANTPPPMTEVTFEACYFSIRFAGDTADHPARCRDDRKRGEQWGNGGDSVVIQIPYPSGTTFATDYDQVLVEHFERGHPGVLVSSSTAGYMHLQGGLDIDLVVAPYTPEDRKKLTGDILELPLFVTPVAIAAHVPGAAQLRLSPRTLARILQREITAWSDPAIAKDNPGAAPPAGPITVIHTHGSSLSVDAVSSYVTAAAPGAWKLGRGRQLAWPGDTQIAQFDDQLAEMIAATDGAIGVVPLAIAQRHGVAAVQVARRGGGFVAPSPASATRAVGARTQLRPGLVEVAARDGYPLVYATAAIVYTHQTDPAKAPWVTSFLRYVLTDGQAVLEGLGHGPLPRPLAARGLAQLARIEVPH